MVESYQDTIAGLEHAMQCYRDSFRYKDVIDGKSSVIQILSTIIIVACFIGMMLMFLLSKIIEEEATSFIIVYVSLVFFSAEFALLLASKAKKCKVIR